MTEERGFPLNNTQLSIWTGQKINPSVPLYNMAMLYEIRGQVDEAAFQTAFQKLIDLTDSLRLTFHESNSVPRQSVIPTLQYEVEVLDWTELKVDQTFILNWASEKSQQIFELSKCLFESVLIRLPDNNYLWFFNQHHLITDGQTQEILYKRFGDLYSKTIKGIDQDEDSVPEFIDSLDNNIQSNKDYWEQKISSIKRINKVYRSLTKTSSTSSVRISSNLDLELTQKIKDLASRPEFKSWNSDLSIFNIFLAALFVFLHRISHQEEIAIAAPVHGRHNKKLKETAGLFIEIFPLLGQLHGQKYFSDFLKEISLESLEFLKNATTGLNNLEWSKKHYAILNFITASYSKFDVLDVKSHWIHPNHMDPHHILRLQVHDFDNTGRFHLHFDLNLGVFENPEDVTSHFLNLLTGLIENPFQPIGNPPLVEQESVKSLSSGNDVFGNGLIDLLTKELKKDPEKLCIEYQDSTLTRGDLQTRSDQLASQLLKAGFTKGDRFGIYMNRSPELLISILAVFKIRGAFVPLAMDNPFGRIEWVANDSRLSAILTNGDYKALNGLELPIIDVNNSSPEISEEYDEISIQDPEPADLAYIMYTSGSTGSPKGVMISQVALMNYLMWAKSAYDVDEHSVFPLFSSIGFDLTITSLFLPLLAGAKIIIYEEREMNDLSVLRVIEDNKVNFIKLTPSHLRLISDKNLKKSNIKTIIIGGEDLKTSLVRSVYSAFQKDVALINEYGPTEATVGCVYHKLNPSNLNTDSVPIGTPIANMDALVLDDNLNQVPKGMTGEIYLSGLGLSKGYWGNEQLTKARFIHHPKYDNLILYRTGDLGFINKAGELVFSGREDDQVKVNGVRVELAEIEAIINQFPGISLSSVNIQKPLTPESKEISYCNNCGLPSNYPNVVFDERGVCNLCTSFDTYKERVKNYFGDMKDLKKILQSKQDENTPYDCLVLYSGGKDSTYALAQVVEMGFNPLAFTLDNGYISDQAKDNIKRVVNALQVDHIFGETEAMNEIFVDSLKQHCNVCNGCFKTIYTLSTKLALQKNIPFIVTGLSRGQFFETRLTEELFWNKELDPEDIDRIILDARKAYHRLDDAVSRLLDVSIFKQDDTFDKVQFVDFYRYCDASLGEMYTYLDEKLPWVRPTDTGRSTNCLINKVGIYRHKKELGYSNYAFPYSWDVRIGHKTRKAALEEINEEIDPDEVKSILDEIGFSENEAGNLVAHFVSDDDINPDQLRNYLSDQLPSFMIPRQLLSIDTLPITKNGKIDRGALLDLKTKEKSRGEFVSPRNEIEKIVSDIWSDILGVTSISMNDNFLELGGQSLQAIRIITRINDTMRLSFPVNTIFEELTVENMANRIEEHIKSHLSSHS